MPVLLEDAHSGVQQPPCVVTSDDDDDMTYVSTPLGMMPVLDAGFWNRARAAQSEPSEADAAFGQVIRRKALRVIDRRRRFRRASARPLLARRGTRARQSHRSASALRSRRASACRLSRDGPSASSGPAGRPALKVGPGSWSYLRALARCGERVAS